MNKLNVGFSKVNINPPLGISVAGYYIDRFAKVFWTILISAVSLSSVTARL